MRAMFVGVVLLVASGAAVSQRAPSPEPTTRKPAGVPASLLARADTQSDLVSFFELLGSPAAFQGKRVRVVGFAHVEFEGKGLYFHKEDFENGLVKNALWLNVDLMHPEFTALNDRYVIVEGVFKAGPRGHFGIFGGALAEISRYDPWPTRAQLEAEATAQP